MRGRLRRPAPQLQALAVNQHKGPPSRRQRPPFEQVVDGMRLRLPSLQQKLRAKLPVLCEGVAVVFHKPLQLPHEQRISAERPPQAVEERESGPNLRAAITVRPGESRIEDSEIYPRAPDGTR